MQHRIVDSGDINEVGWDAQNHGSENMPQESTSTRNTMANKTSKAIDIGNPDDRYNSNPSHCYSKQATVDIFPSGIDFIYSPFSTDTRLLDPEYLGITPCSEFEVRESSHSQSQSHLRRQNAIRKKRANSTRPSTLEPTTIFQKISDLDTVTSSHLQNRSEKAAPSLGRNRPGARAVREKRIFACGTRMQPPSNIDSVSDVQQAATISNITPNGRGHRRSQTTISISPTKALPGLPSTPKSMFKPGSDLLTSYPSQNQETSSEVSIKNPAGNAIPNPRLGSSQDTDIPLSSWSFPAEASGINNAPFGSHDPTEYKAPSTMQCIGELGDAYTQAGVEDEVLAIDWAYWKLNGNSDVDNDSRALELRKFEPKTRDTWTGSLLSHFDNSNSENYPETGEPEPEQSPSWWEIGIKEEQEEVDSLEHEILHTSSEQPERSSRFTKPLNFLKDKLSWKGSKKSKRED
ncbi:hypothetical protein BS50DRAFT_587415 [Corynespora cassiicola Philippines]|uniref:Uncharacterized protein n=1 Tax=Corynespora cassiicola Philippines TaxID=1448308 RepID=A0A2T2NRZ7_CORCC|nr:hypothetical protein BS50DRAFT_587415 [Corynespora cassiicola Philippines]